VCAVPKSEDADALPKIVRLSPIPVIADIHFNASLALRAIDAGVAAVRINPGQHRRAGQGRGGGALRQGGRAPDAHRRELGLAAEAPGRAGAGDQAEALVEAALEEVRLLESLGFYDFKISVKSSHVPTMIRAYRLLASKVPYPLHLGVTEAARRTPARSRARSGWGRCSWTGSATRSGSR
jgi:(E)-4-hydroxy-3-methylbut-2-enyl-diphosphate synthase